MLRNWELRIVWPPLNLQIAKSCGLIAILLAHREIPRLTLQKPTT